MENFLRKSIRFFPNESSNISRCFSNISIKYKSWIISIGCSVAAFLLYNYGLKKLSASASVSLMNLVPVLGIVFFIFLLEETVTLTQIIGGAIVIISVILSSIQKRNYLMPCHRKPLWNSSIQKNQKLSTPGFPMFTNY
ncbi:DMT family transporter [Bacillus circulans]|nr:DMT family transporter [Niallia circulans]